MGTKKMGYTDKLKLVTGKADSEDLCEKLLDFIATVRACNSTEHLDVVKEITADPDMIALESIDLSTSVVKAESLENNIKLRKISATMAKEGINFITMGQNALQEIGNLFEYALGLCQQAQSDLLSDEDRNDLETEYAGVLEAMRLIATNTNYNGVTILTNPNDSVADNALNDL